MVSSRASRPRTSPSTWPVTSWTSSRSTTSSSTWVRVDRWDANQNVLSDPYLWRPAYTAGSAVPNSAVAGEQANRPGNIGDDFVVYVDNINSPTSVVGYRDGDTWYNAQGAVLSDPRVLRRPKASLPIWWTMTPDPDGSLPGSKLRREAFEDYKPVVNVMPRMRSPSRSPTRRCSSRTMMC